MEAHLLCTHWKYMYYSTRTHFILNENNLSVVYGTRSLVPRLHPTFNFRRAEPGDEAVHDFL